MCVSAPLKTLISFLDSFDINDIEVTSPEQDMNSLENGAANCIRLVPCLQAALKCTDFVLKNGVCYSMIVSHMDTRLQPQLRCTAHFPIEIAMSNTPRQIGRQIYIYIASLDYNP